MEVRFKPVFFDSCWNRRKGRYRFDLAPATFWLLSDQVMGKARISCAEIVAIAQQRNPSLGFAVAFPDKDEFGQAFRPSEKFDYILFNDIGDTVDVLQAFRNLKPLCQRHTRVLVTTYNHLWEPLVTLRNGSG
jgi:hypothetical protein